MATGLTTTGSLADSLPTVIDAARIVREYEGVYMRTTDAQKLPEGTGLKWDEISLAKLTAQSVTETTELDNPQQLSDSILSAEPVLAGIQIRITDRARIRIDNKVAAKIGVLGQNAIQRKKDGDYLSTLDSATTSLSGAGTTLASGIIGAAAARIKGNTTERGMGALFTVLHPFQIKDLQDEIVSGVGTYAIPSGMTEATFRQGFNGTVYGTNVFEDGNITIDGSDDAKGGVHAKEGVVFVQGRSPWAKTVRREEIGGGADDMFLYDEYVFVERSAGNWLYEVYSDATSPTS